VCGGKVAPATLNACYAARGDVAAPSAAQTLAVEGVLQRGLLHMPCGDTVCLSVMLAMLVAMHAYEAQTPDGLTSMGT